MKKTIISALALAMVVVACQKQGVAPQNSAVNSQTENVSASTETIKESAKKPVIPEYTLIDVFGEEMFCWYPGDDCLEEFVVWGEHQPTLGAVVTTIERENTAAIVQAFIDKRSVLLEYIDATYVDGVIDGTYTVESEHGAKNAEYVQFYDTDGELVIVYPMIINE